MLAPCFLRRVLRFLGSPGCSFAGVDTPAQARHGASTQRRKGGKGVFHWLAGITNRHLQVYSFVPIPGSQQHKRPRRRYEEIERMYKCGWNGCEKAYGTLNHLNAHVTMQGHGPKRTPDGMPPVYFQSHFPPCPSALRVWMCLEGGCGWQVLVQVWRD